MKEPISNYLKNSKSVLKEIIADLSKEYKYVSILGTDVKGKTYAVYKSLTSIADSGNCERGFVLRVYNGYGYSEYSFDKIDKETVISKVKQLVEEDIERLKNNGEKFIEYPVITEEAIFDSYESNYEIHPEKVGAEKIVERLSTIVNKASKDYPQLVEFRAVFEWVSVSKIFLSDKKDLEQSYLFSTAICVAVVSDGEKYESSYDAFTELQGLELLDKLEKNYDKTIKTAIELLGAERIKPGEYDIICDPSIAGLIAHEAFGHGAEMDMFVKNRAKAKEFIGEKIASDITSMRDGATSAENVSSYLFDDEGVIGQDTLVIDNGIFKTGYADQLSALKLGVEPTGNGKRESFKRKAYTRMTNTFFEAGESKLEDMIKSIDYGYLLESYNSGMEDPKNWGIQCVLSLGREIKDGKLTGKVVSPVVLTGYVPDLLKSISMVSDDFKLYGSGYCGKGYKEFVKTSLGGAYIKARGILG